MEHGWGLKLIPVLVIVCSWFATTAPADECASAVQPGSPQKYENSYSGSLAIGFSYAYVSHATLGAVEKELDESITTIQNALVPKVAGRKDVTERIDDAALLKEMYVSKPDSVRNFIANVSDCLYPNLPGKTLPEIIAMRCKDQESSILNSSNFPAPSSTASDAFKRLLRRKKEGNGGRNFDTQFFSGHGFLCGPTESTAAQSYCVGVPNPYEALVGRKQQNNSHRLYVFGNEADAKSLRPESESEWNKVGMETVELDEVLDIARGRNTFLDACHSGEAPRVLLRKNKDYGSDFGLFSTALPTRSVEDGKGLISWLAGKLGNAVKRCELDLDGDGSISRFDVAFAGATEFLPEQSTFDLENRYLSQSQLPNPLVLQTKENYVYPECRFMTQTMAANSSKCRLVPPYGCDPNAESKGPAAATRGGGTSSLPPCHPDVAEHYRRIFGKTVGEFDDGTVSGQSAEAKIQVGLTTKNGNACLARNICPSRIQKNLSQCERAGARLANMRDSLNNIRIGSTAKKISRPGFQTYAQMTTGELQANRALLRDLAETKSFILDWYLEQKANQSACGREWKCEDKSSLETIRASFRTILEQIATQTGRSL